MTQGDGSKSSAAQTCMSQTIRTARTAPHWIRPGEEATKSNSAKQESINEPPSAIRLRSRTTIRSTRRSVASHMHELFALTEGEMMGQWSDVSGSITLSLNSRHPLSFPSPPSSYFFPALLRCNLTYAHGASSHAMSTELAPYGNSRPPPAYPPPTYQGSPEFQALSRAYEAGLCQFLSSLYIRPG